MKKLLSLILVGMLVLSLAAPAMAEAPKYKIAILTGTTSQGEEEYRAAESLKTQYPDMVVTDTYPDNASSEVETTIGKLQQFAADPEVKAIIMVQAVMGATAAFTQIRQDRPDILLIAGVPAEDPSDIGAAADYVMAIDEINGGEQIMETAVGWGADVFIHYSFARHMGYETIVARYNILKAAAEDAGVEFYAVDAPDPMAEGGATVSQAFILEDVPKQMAMFEGKKVAFFTTNCGMQEALQQAVLKEENALYPLPCCPSPFHGFPASLGLEFTEEEKGDLPLVLEKLAGVLKENNALDRMSTWPAPVNMAMVVGSFEYAKDYIENGGERADMAKLEQYISTAANGSAQLTPYEDDNGNVVENYFMIYFDNVDFNDYVK